MGLLFAVVVYGVVVGHSGYRAVRESLSSFDWWAFAIALGLSSCNYVLRFAKWQYYLRLLGIEHVRRGHSALIFLSGFVLTVTPGKLGEVFKSAVLARTHGVPMERTAPIVLAERLTDVIAIVVLIALGSLGFQGGALWAAIGVALVALGLAFVVWDKPARSLLALLDARPRLQAFRPAFERAYQSLRVVAAPTALLWPVLLSVVGWGLEGLSLHLLLVGFGQHPSLAFSVFFYASATLAGAVIPVPGGLGVTEAMLVEQMVRVALVPHPVATAAMLLIRGSTLWWAVLVGFVALGWLRLVFPRELGQEPRSSETLNRA